MQLTFEGGLLGFIHLALSLWAIISVINSKASGLGKVIWILFVLFFPVIGLIIWFFIGPKSAR
ncbi:phospholipase D-like protein [Litorimonas taeanensis]|uniref:Phospholipase D-like protein n=1 Tax=Litorimonas taeanensis TaxID=568099 RepID=A0A420WF23_9PROT|nr:PLD nuclease N-terminal domain-containing protein [Litorimonas taeanensis]RKQ69586.1 phospholipase D-like protein [Litorimonas taeanensis]